MRMKSGAQERERETDPSFRHWRVSPSDARLALSAILNPRQLCLCSLREQPLLSLPHRRRRRSLCEPPSTASQRGRGKVAVCVCVCAPDRVFHQFRRIFFTFFFSFFINKNLHHFSIYCVSLVIFTNRRPITYSSFVLVSNRFLNVSRSGSSAPAHKQTESDSVRKYTSGQSVVTKTV